MDMDLERVIEEHARTDGRYAIAYGLIQIASEIADLPHVWRAWVAKGGKHAPGAKDALAQAAGNRSRLKPK